MIESHLNEGRQDVPNEGPQGLKHGVSITDACVDWERTVTMMDKLNAVCNQANIAADIAYEHHLLTGCGPKAEHNHRSRATKTRTAATCRALGIGIG